MPNKHFVPTDDVIIAMAEKFGKMPHEIERDLPEYWFTRTLVIMDAETLDRERRDREMEAERKRR